MMGHREPMKGGSEYDALTRAKRFYHWKPGVRQWIKRQFSKRVSTGPVMLCDTTETVWTGNEYRRKWRLVARKCGIPDNVWNMDSRSGAISEAIAAGAPIEFVRHAATHSDVSQTADYDRGQAEATAKVMRLRVENRKKTDFD